jgi:hypothetical protein
LGDFHNVRLELIKWETHTRPGFGEDGQDVIIKQIGDEYDIFVGIMWGRFGSPTKRAGSGTEEEFKRAYSRFKASPDSVQIMFYFKEDGISPSKMDPEQIAKIQEFKKKISSEYGGLYHAFETTEDFCNKVRMHLSWVVQDLLRNKPLKDTVTVKSSSAGGIEIEPLAVPTPIVMQQSAGDDTIDPLANFNALDDDDSEGLIELAEIANTAMEAVVESLADITEATNEIGEKSQIRASEFNQLTADGSEADMNDVKRVCNNTAKDIEAFVKRLSESIPEFSKQNSLAMDTFGKLAMIFNVDLDEDPANIRTTLAILQEYRSAIPKASESQSELRQTISNLPRMTTAFNRARRRAVAVLDDFIAQLQAAENQTSDVEKLLERMLDSTDQSAK